jgi:hypothetical protein
MSVSYCQTIKELDEEWKRYGHVDNWYRNVVRKIGFPDTFSMCPIFPTWTMKASLRLRIGTQTPSAIGKSIVALLMV